jgi:hypothetical protein
LRLSVLIQVALEFWLFLKFKSEPSQQESA